MAGCLFHMIEISDPDDMNKVHDRKSFQLYLEAELIGVQT